MNPRLTVCRCSQADDFLDVLGGRGKEGGKRWRLVFNAGTLPSQLTGCQAWEQDPSDQATPVMWDLILKNRKLLAMSGQCCCGRQATRSTCCCQRRAS